MKKDNLPKVEYVTGIYHILIDEPKGVRRNAWGSFYPGQGMDGYGAKITTDKLLYFPYADNNGKYDRRKYRVYATCFSNVASHWIIKNGKKLHISLG